MTDFQIERRLRENVLSLQKALDKRDEESKSLRAVLQGYKDVVAQNNQLIEDQAAEIRKAKEDYDREMASMDRLAEEGDKRLTDVYTVLEVYKLRLQQAEMQIIDLQRQIAYLEQFQSQHP